MPDAPRELLDSGPLRSAYLSAVTAARRGLDGTALLRGWDDRTARRPRSRLAHLRTLLAVHNAEDLVTLDLPWWTYQAVDHVSGFLAGRGYSARVFEYGSGASTLWLARRCTSLDAVEHHAEWAARVRELVDGTDGLRCTPTLHVPEVPAVAPGTAPRVASGAPSGRGLDFGAYVDVVHDVGGQFDLVTVDGRAREASLLASLDHVAPDGLLLLDDAQRPRYREVVRQAERLGWYALRTRGATPCQPVPRETVLLSRHPFRAAR